MRYNQTNHLMKIATDNKHPSNEYELIIKSFYIL